MWLVTNEVLAVQLFHVPFLQGDLVAGVGYKLDLGSLTVRGRVDSHGTVVAGVEKHLDPLPAVLLLNGQINHWTDESKFGVGLTVG